jgi:hypothetical protein
MDSVSNDAALPAPGFPIRRSSAHSPLSGSPKLFAASHVLHRLLAPRHSPYALSSLTSSPSYLLRSRSGFLTRMQLSKTRMTNPEPGSTLRAHVRTVHPGAIRWSGADRNRTDGLRLARAALSHLSYSPSTLGRAEESGGPR